LGKGLTTPHCENISLLQNIHRQSLGPVLILWYDLSNDHLVDPGVDGRIILRRIIRKWDVGICIGLSWLRIEIGGGHL
jgi:hypothetical protein